MLYPLSYEGRDGRESGRKFPAMPVHRLGAA